MDATAQVVERYRFGAFGLRTVMTPGWSTRASSDYGFEFAHHGQFEDPETGYHDYSYRCYSPGLGRWLSRDPIGERGGFNLYASTGNSPVNALDWLGLIEDGDWCCCTNDLNTVEIANLKIVATTALLRTVEVQDPASFAVNFIKSKARDAAEDAVAERSKFINFFKSGIDTGKKFLKNLGFIVEGSSSAGFRLDKVCMEVEFFCCKEIATDDCQWKLDDEDYFEDYILHDLKTSNGRDSAVDFLVS
ncbi:MAG: RHS repeat-associated core domain-containing protein [Verrucomicrobiales bacterium]